MFKKVIISILFIVFAYVAFSQENTIGRSRLDDNSTVPAATEEAELEMDDVESQTMPIYQKVVIVPFEPKLYVSEADRDIARKTGLVPSQIRNNFRWGINNVLWAEVNKSMPAISMLSKDDAEVKKDLYYLYQSMGYQYQYLPVEKEEVGKTKSEEAYEKVKEKLSSTFKPAEEEVKPGARIQNGQIYSAVNTQERYMHTRIINDNALGFISEKYQVGYFVFINQFDVRIAPGTDQRQLENDMYPREIKVHYTIMDQFGNEIYGGAAKGYFPSVINDMNRIIKGHLPKVAKQIAGHIPLPELNKAQEEKMIIDEQKAKEQRELISGEDF